MAISAMCTRSPIANPRANLTDGNAHVVEVLFGPESTPGAGNGTYQAWVDGVQIAERLQQCPLARRRQTTWSWPYPDVRSRVRWHKE